MKLKEKVAPESSGKAKKKTGKNLSSAVKSVHVEAAGDGFVGELNIESLEDGFCESSVKKSSYQDMKFEDFLRLVSGYSSEKLESLCIASSLFSHRPSAEMMFELSRFCKWGEYFLHAKPTDQEILFLNQISDQILSLRFLDSRKLENMASNFDELVLENATASGSAKEMFVSSMSTLVCIVAGANNSDEAIDAVDFHLSWIESWYEHIKKDHRSALLSVALAGYIGSMVNFMWNFEKHRQLIEMFPQFANHLNLVGTRITIKEMIEN